MTQTGPRRQTGGRRTVCYCFLTNILCPGWDTTGESENITLSSKRCDNKRTKKKKGDKLKARRLRLLRKQYLLCSSLLLFFFFFTVAENFYTSTQKIQHRACQCVRFTLSHSVALWLKPEGGEEGVLHYFFFFKANHLKLFWSVAAKKKRKKKEHNNTNRNTDMYVQ